MEKILLLKYGEMVLKGQNRKYFDNKLISRIRTLLNQQSEKFGGTFELEYAQSTLCVRAFDGADINAAAALMKRVFGIVSICTAYETQKDIDMVLAVMKENLDSLVGNAKTFKIEARRSDKKFPLKSPEICRIAGGEVLKSMPQISVDVHNPEVSIFIEIRDKSAFIHNGGEKGAGGMPNGTNGRAMLLLSGGIDSPVAGFLIGKRGVTLDAVYYESPPYTSMQALEKVQTLAEKLALYCGNIRLHIISVTEIQESILENCDKEMTTILLRRFMMRIAEKLSAKTTATALITGESIGQVASQTMESLAVTDNAVDMLVFRPCIGMDKEEIVTISRKIDTYETSTLPYEDCCSLFTPRHPNIRPVIEQTEKEEEKLEIDLLVKRAIDSLRIISIK